MNIIEQLIAAHPALWAVYGPDIGDFLHFGFLDGTLTNQEFQDGSVYMDEHPLYVYVEPPPPAETVDGLTINGWVNQHLDIFKAFGPYPATVLTHLLENKYITQQQYDDATKFLQAHPGWKLTAELTTPVSENIIGKALDSFGSYVIGLINNVANGVINGLISATGSLLDMYAHAISERIQNKFTGGWKEYFSGWMLDDDIPQSLQDELTRLKENATFYDMIKIVGYITLFDVGYLLGQLKAVFIKAQLDTTADYASLPPDIGSLITAYFRDTSQEETLKDLANRLGYPDASWDKYKIALKPYYLIQEIFALTRRGLLDPDKLVENIQKLGYTEEEATKLSELNNAIPGPSDLVRFSVRESYKDKYAKAFGTDMEIDDQFKADMLKQGYDEDWSKRFWRAHWELPSLEMGFEMLHRTNVGDTAIDDLMKAQDIMPFWRPFIKQITYRPYSRVDVRRMHRVGVLSPGEVKRAYLDLGYDDDKAQHMTDFTILYNQPQHKNLTRTDIEKSRKAYLISHHDAVIALINLGYSTEDAGIIIARIEHQQQAETEKLKIDSIHKNFILGKVSDHATTDALTKAGLEADNVNALMINWRLEKQMHVLDLNKAEVLKAHKAGITLEPSAKDRLVAMGYSKETADTLLEISMH